jgi:hypothetical protein
MEKIHFDISTKTINELYEKINKHTQYNEHNYAVLVLVDFLEFEDYKTEMGNIIDRHEMLGFMDSESMERRDEIRQICLSIFRLYYGNDAVKKLYSAY